MYDNTFFVLDFDRCLGDTDGIQRILEDVLWSEAKLQPELLRTERARVEASGRTFDTIRQTKRLLEATTIEWEHVRKKLFEKAAAVELLLPGARQFLKELEARQLPYGIITYGIEEAWQLTKLELAGLLTVPHLVTHIEAKGELLAGWKQADGCFIIPPALTTDFRPLRVDAIIFLDDKAKSFSGIPSGVRGVHIIAPGGNKLPSQQGSVPVRVDDVIGMNGASSLLFAI